jgi:hypothetical protein
MMADYRNAKVSKNNSMIADDDLRELESVIGRLPEDYRQWMLEFNGGEPAIEDESFWRHWSVSEFYGINPEVPEMDIAGVLEDFKGRMPAHFLPIGEDAGGNQVCISTAKQDFGCVYLWDHENERGPEDQPYYKNCRLLAKSFEEYVQPLL